MKPTALWPAVLLGALACGQGDGQRGTAAQDTARRDLQLAPADTTAALGDVPAPADTALSPVTPAADTAPTAAPAPKPATPKPSTTKPRTSTSTSAAPASKPAEPAPTATSGKAAAPETGRSLASGTTFTATLRDSIDSKTTKAGDVVSLRVASDVQDENGRTVIPKGATVKARVASIKWSENKGDKGTLTLEPTSVTIDGASHDLSGSVKNPAFAYRKRGGALGDASKVGAGAAAGAVVGGLLGKGTGAVVGGVVGGAVGAQRAVETKDRDIILAPGSEMTVKLSSAFSR